MKPASNSPAAVSIIAAAVVAFVCTMGTLHFFGPSAAPSGTSAASGNRYQEVQKRGIIHAGYYVGAPYFTLDPNTKQKGGIFYEVVERVAKKLNLKVEWTGEVGFGEMAEGLRSGKFDIIGSGIWISAARGSAADFSDPVLYDVVGAYVRADDHRYDANIRLANSKETRISTIDGEMAATIASSDFPQASIVSLPQNTDFTQMILNVVSNKADITFLGLGPARKFDVANPNQIRNVAPLRPLRVFPTAIMLPQNEYSLKRAIDLALTEMLNDGEIESIIEKYEETPGSHYRVAPEYALPAK